MTVQKFNTYDEQINKLRNEKKLIIDNPSYAKEILQKIGYYSLINGYKELFKHKPSGNYIRGVTFEEITAFYFFDEELRTLFLKYILHVERHLKSMLSYYFCEKHGIQQSAYLNYSNYNFTHKNITEINRLIISLTNSVSLPSRYSYITHHAATYGNIPLWVMTNTLTFGQISKMYQYSMSDIRTKISKNFSNMTEVQLHQFIRILASCRNVCAHNERLYSFRVNESIPDMPLHSKLKISKKNNQYSIGKHDLFAVVIALRYLMSNDEFRQFLKTLKRLIRTTLNKCPHVPKEKLLSEMGFPLNWESICRYKK